MSIFNLFEYEVHFVLEFNTYNIVESTTRSDQEQSSFLSHIYNLEAYMVFIRLAINLRLIKSIDVEYNATSTESLFVLVESNAQYTIEAEEEGGRLFEFGHRNK